MLGTSLVVQWLRLDTSAARGAGSIHGWGTGFHLVYGVAKNKIAILASLKAKNVHHLVSASSPKQGS